MTGRRHPRRARSLLKVGDVVAELVSTIAFNNASRTSVILEDVPTLDDLAQTAAGLLLLPGAAQRVVALELLEVRVEARLSDHGPCPVRDCVLWAGHDPWCHCDDITQIERDEGHLREMVELRERVRAVLGECDREESAEAARRGRAWFAHARRLQWEAFDAFDAKDYEKAERLAIESQDAFEESGVCPMPAPIEGGEPS